MIFQKKNFKPTGELSVYAVNYNGEETFDPARSFIPFSDYHEERIGAPINDNARDILRNIPFARRGYVFTNKEIQHYYETMVDWYIPNPGYKPEVEFLTEKEQAWVKRWK